jgi:Fungal specific transcription factor domain
MNEPTIVRMEFIEEYSQSYISFDDIISLPQARTQLNATNDNHNLLATVKPEAIQLFGVQDGLSFHISQITSIRNAIRSNMEQGLTPVVDYTVLYRAVEIDAAIREWRSPRPWNDLGDLIDLLYKQMLWIYLWRTIYPLKSTSWELEHKITAAVEEGVALLESFPPRNRVQTLLLAPTFIIGCGAFDPAQRSSVRSSICTIKENTELKDTDRALEVLEQVWRYMDQKDERSWDWQSIAHEMRMQAAQRSAVT